MHDFEAANSDELELKRGEVVLVIPTDSLEDQVHTNELLSVEKTRYIITYT